jgi:hypothetical protein
MGYLVDMQQLKTEMHDLSTKTLQINCELVQKWETLKRTLILVNIMT